MSLPILKVVNAPNAETLVRYFHQTEANWTAHLAEAVDLEFGTASTNAQLPNVHQANRMLGVALPTGTTPQAAYDAANAFFAERQVKCWQWVINPSAPDAQAAPMVEFLLAQGLAPRHETILYLSRITGRAIPQASLPLKIIPARASFRHAQQLMDATAQESGEAQLAEAGMSHLDDPHYDALLALVDDQAVAMAGVLSAGEIARIEQVFVMPSHRAQHIGATMIARALEICARSLHKHIFVSVTPDQSAAAELYASFGFKELGIFTAYQAP